VKESKKWTATKVYIIYLIRHWATEAPGHNFAGPAKSERSLQNSGIRFEIVERVKKRDDDLPSARDLQIVSSIPSFVLQVRPRAWLVPGNGLFVRLRLRLPHGGL
jgi:hypothetical protein